MTTVVRHYYGFLFTIFQVFELIIEFKILLKVRSVRFKKELSMTRKVYNIGVEVTMDTIGGKWKPIILCNLRHGDKRPSELQALIPNISQKC